MSTFALIVGGGTAGHVLPGIAIGRELTKRGHEPDSIHFVGSERGVEKRLVPDAGFGLTLLPGRGIQRRLTTENLGAIVGLLRAFVTSFSLVKRHRPDVVVALGGYASVPTGLSALLRRVPVVVAEQNAVPGLANKVIGRFASAAAVSYRGTDLPRAVWTGNPVRPEVLAIAELSAQEVAAARRDVGVGEAESLVVVFGGSLGARTINDAVVGALERLSTDRSIHIRHITGTRDYRDVVARTERWIDGDVRYSAIEYEDEMAKMYAAADLVVCRSGATSCAELAVSGTPSVLIPLPGAPGDHQTENAKALEEVGGAERIADKDFDAAAFVAVLDRLLDDPTTLSLMGERARTLARPDAAEAVVDLVESYARTADR